MHKLVSPASAFDLATLVSMQLHAQPALPLPGGGATLTRWRALAAFAAEDVCGAKVLEAHHDALAILAELGATGFPGSGRAGGPVYAVWAAETADTRLDLLDEDGGVLVGSKAWCSGADLVDAALVTARRDGRSVLALVELAQPAVQRVHGEWHAVGMARVESGPVRFQRARARQIGAADAYLQRPGFWHGGAGIAACWFGAAAAIGDTLRRHPRARRDPLAAVHLGAVDMALSAAASLLRETAAAIDAEPAAAHRAAVIRLRSVVERACSEVIDRVGRALGAAPLCLDDAHARRCADLATFLRQSHAEHDWAALGEAVVAQEVAWAL